MVQVSVRLADGALEDQVRAALVREGLEVAEEPGEALVVVEQAPASLDEVSACVARLDSCRRVKPALVLLAVGQTGYSREQALRAGAALLVDGDALEELPALVGALCRLRAGDLDSQPLTGLPGSAALQRECERRLVRQEPLALVSLDLRHFKAFNDHYGFDRGDCVLKFLANLLEEVVKDGGNVYHVGGDDFCIVTEPGRADGIAQAAIAGFDEARDGFYDDEDLRRGYVPGLSRATGEVFRFPLMTLTVTCATNEAEDVRHLGQLAIITAQLRQYAKAASGSTYARDRRLVHDVARSLQIREKQKGGE